MDMQTNIRPIVEYITAFLLYGDTAAATRVGYTADEQEWEKYSVVIVPNGHLGKDIVLPDMGKIETEQRNKTCIIHTDLIYNTFFFISRAEELINPQRDEHGRFCAKYSLLGQGNRLNIPLVDEYAHILMKRLELDIPTPHYEHIYLTHDIDTMEQYRHVRGFLGGLYRGEWSAVRESVKDIHKDPVYTFPYLVEKDNMVRKAQKIYFIKHTQGKGYDYPQYNLQGRDFGELKAYLQEQGAIFGLHSSYYGIDERLRIKDKGLNSSDYKNSETSICSLSSLLLNSSSQSVLHRSHYLRCSIEQMQRLADAGITDDFTMAFPDRAGFRLQTTRAVRWINPLTMQLTPLTLHPLTVMDCTLSNENYMNLQTEDEAYFFCEQLLDKVRQYGGDVCLLWHNSIFWQENYHKSLYTKLLKGLRHYSKPDTTCAS